MKKHELKQAIGQATDKLLEMAGTSAKDGFDENVYKALEAEILSMKEQADRMDSAEKVAAALARPIEGSERPTPRAPKSAYRLYSSLKNFKDRQIGGVEIKAEDQAYTVGMWFRAAIFGNESAKVWCRENGVPIAKAQGEGVDSAGGFLVPEELLANIIVLREQYGVFRRSAFTVPMGRDLVNWPRRIGGLTSYFTGESQAITESQAAWDNIALSAKKLGILVRMSTEIEEDAVISIADWLTGEMAYEFARKEDDCGFNGDGTGTYGGIRGTLTLAIDGNHNSGKYAAASPHNLISEIDMTDLVGLMGTLPYYAKPSAKWYMSNPVFLSLLGRLAATAGGNRMDVLTGQIAEQFLGYPVVISQLMPLSTGTTDYNAKGILHFGDLRLSSALGERRQITMRRSDERWFENDQIGLLATERFDINNHDMGDAIAGKAGPIVTLIGTT